MCVVSICFWLQFLRGPAPGLESSNVLRRQPPQSLQLAILLEGRIHMVSVTGFLKLSRPLPVARETGDWDLLLNWGLIGRVISKLLLLNKAPDADNRNV